MGGGGGVGAGGSGYMDKSPGVVIFPGTGSFIVGVPYAEGGSIRRFSGKKKKRSLHYKDERLTGGNFLCN